MDRGWAVVVGMSVAYLASFLGMFFAYLGYRRRKKEQAEKRSP
jgi:H+/gluconate symporter-like permease